VKQEEVLSLPAPGRADAGVAQLRSLIGCIPALENQVERLRSTCVGITLETNRLYSAASGRRRLLILASKVAFTQSDAQLSKQFQWLAPGMKDFPGAAPNRARPKRRLDFERPILLGDGRKAQSGKPVAKLVPVDSSPDDFYGSMKGKGK
jgi:hypothetical protein